MEETCRLCRKGKEVFLEPIFDYRDGFIIAELVMKICPVQIDENDTYPQLICEECLEITMSACQLQKISLDSDKWFRSQSQKNVLGDLFVKKEQEENFTAVKIEHINEEDFHFADICGISGETEQGMDQHKADDHLLPMFVPTEVKQDQPKEVPLLVRKTRADTHFNPQPLPGQKKLKYEETFYQCSFCSKQMKPRRIMLRHMRLKHDPQQLPHGCRFCVKRFDTEFKVREHEACSHENEEPNMFFCDYCGASGTNKEGMEVHIVSDHVKSIVKGKVMTYNCGICDISFSKRDKLDSHNAVNHLEKVLSCSKCDDKFHDRQSLKNHVMMVHDKLFRALSLEEIEQDLSCCACSQAFTNANDLLIHVESHRPNFSEIKCIHCPVPVKTFEVFMKHVKYHMKAKTHQCSHCHKFFSFDSKFICHVKSHKRNWRKKLKCDQCNNSYRSAKDLEIHCKIKHNNETLFICPICAKSLGSATILDNHIKYVHNGDLEKKFECRVCKLKFPHNSKLMRHQATHSTVRAHVCELCGAGFKTKEGLTIHMKRHAGTFVKKHQCTQCAHKSTTKHRLNVHMLTHTGAKPNACEYCDRAYASKGDLVKHLQKVHVGNAVYKCDKCPLAFPKVVELREHQTQHMDPTSIP